MITEDMLRELLKDSDKVILTQHSAMRFRERGIRYDDIVSAITGGEIIEQYPSDFPNPSCLLLGFSIKKKYLHVVCGTDGEYL